MTAQLLRPDYRYLKPGELMCPERPLVVSTILGSCLAITMYSPRLSLGGMCHAVLPSGNGEKNMKYLDQAFAFMLQHFARLGVDREKIEVKLFGGADTLSTAPRQVRAAEMVTIGRQNIVTARAMIEREGLRLAASDLGGRLGRKILFYSHTGEIFLKRFAIRDMSL
jgi:chemotaxis protein CheD